MEAPKNADSLIKQLIIPAILAIAATFVTVLIAHIYNWFPLGLLFAGWFAILGNAMIVIYLARKKPRIIGGSFSHIGFGVLLLGILASTLFNKNMLDASTRSYNTAVEQGTLRDTTGTLIRQKAQFVQLKLNEPKVINGQYVFTYKGYTLEGQTRPGEQQYTIQIEPLHGSGQGITMEPQVYALSSVSPGGKITWSIDTDVHLGFMYDIYLYVAGSSYAQRINREIIRHNEQRKLGQQVSKITPIDSSEVLQISLQKGETIEKGAFKIKLESFQTTNTKSLPKNTKIAIRATLEVTRKASFDTQTIHPLFAIYTKNGKNWSFSPPVRVEDGNVSFQFTNIDPKTGTMSFRVKGLNTDHEKAWILVVAEKKPFISLVWIGSLMIMCGFIVSIFRHRGRSRPKKKD